MFGMIYKAACPWGGQGCRRWLGWVMSGPVTPDNEVALGLGVIFETIQCVKRQISKHNTSNKS